MRAISPADTTQTEHAEHPAGHPVRTDTPTIRPTSQPPKPKAANPSREFACVQRRAHADLHRRTPWSRLECGGASRGGIRCHCVQAGPAFSAASDPGRFLAGLGQDPPAFDSETSRTALKDYEYPLGGDARYPGYGSGNFGGKPRSFRFWVALAYPAADEDWTGWYTVGVDAVGGDRKSVV